MKNTNRSTERKVARDIRKNIHGIRKRREIITKKNTRVTMKRRVDIRNRPMMKPIAIVNITKVERKRRKENTDIRNITKKDPRRLDITRKQTKTNITKNTNSTMISMKKESIRNTETNMNIIMRRKENTR